MATTLGKIMAVGVLGTGITVAGVMWTGSESLNNVKTSLDNMKNEFVEAVEENTFLKSQYERLSGLYSSGMNEANGKIAELVATRDALTAQIGALQAQLDEQTDTSQEQAELQAEINRLEAALTQANEEAAALEAYAATVEESTQFTPMTEEEKAAFTATEIKAASVPVSVDYAAQTLDSTKAAIMAETANVAFMQTEVTKYSKGKVNTIVGVSAYDGTLAYVVEQPFEGSTIISGNMVNFIENTIGTTQIYVVNADNSFVAVISSTKKVTVLKTP